MVCFRLNSSKRMIKKNKRSAGFGHCDQKQKQKQKQNEIENWLFLNKFMFTFDLLAFVCICVLAWFISFITMESNGFGTFSMFRLNVTYRPKIGTLSVASFSLSEGSRDEPTQQQHCRRRCCRCLTHSQSTNHLSEQNACARSVLLLCAR